MRTSLKALISKLNPTCRAATERAASVCLARGHHEVDLEHLLLALCATPQCDFLCIAQASGIDGRALETELEQQLERFRVGNDRTPVFSLRIPRLFEQAWLVASLDEQVALVRSGHLLLALLAEPELAQYARRISALFEHIRVDDLKHDFARFTAASVEGGERCGAGSGGASLAGRTVSADEGADGALTAATPALDRYTTNLTGLARAGKIDPVIGRDGEIRQMIDILLRRRQNNPILTGEAGVGKTAVVEGFALRLASGAVPPALREVELLALDMGLLQAGASVKGEFENRLKGVINEVKGSLKPIILFIDEAHTLIGAGGQAGQNDAANLLKPALARGELRTVAATTRAEYRKYFEKDAALARRFQVVRVDEPDEALAAAMLRGMVPLLERHFGIRVLDEAVTEAVRLSHRYLSSRQLPDKAVSVLDTACARVALARSASPACIDDAEQALGRLRVERGALEREAASTVAHAQRLLEIEGLVDEAESTLAGLRRRHAREQVLVAEILGQRRKMEAASCPADAMAGRTRRAGNDSDARLGELKQALAELQGESAMVAVEVDRHVIAEVVSGWTGIPLGKMVKDEFRTVLNLQTLLMERVLGQDHALEAVAQRIRTARANLDDPDKPKGVFLFVGPSGVGKTETALALADVLYGGERKLITINMSEYQEAHSVAGLKGAPPGYVGYGEGGVLTEAVRRNPHCVVLLDEVEKAHPDVLELFFQVFDKGRLEDAEGREVDFRNTLIILTSNVGDAQIMQRCLNAAPASRPSAAALAEELRPLLSRQFKPAFLGRLTVVPFFPIADEVLARIIRLKLDRIGVRVATNHKARFSHDTALTGAILARCAEVESGARNVDHILNGTILPGIAAGVLARIAAGEPVGAIRVTTGKKGDFRYLVR